MPCHAKVLSSAHLCLQEVQQLRVALKVCQAATTPPARVGGDPHSSRALPAPAHVAAAGSRHG